MTRPTWLLVALCVGLLVTLASTRRALTAARAELAAIAALDEGTSPGPSPSPPPANEREPRPTVDTLIVERSVRVSDPSDSIALAIATERIALLERQLAAREARGLLRFPSAKGGTVRYVGDISDGMATGSGYGVWSTGSIYEGEWLENRKHGTGTYTWPDGERYEGEFRDDKRAGAGTYRWKDGRRWVGGWLDDMRHGEGVLYEASGRVRVRGRWERDKLVQELPKGRDLS